MADVTVTSSVQTAVVENAEVTPLFAAEKAEKRNRDQYGAACDQLWLQLVPMAVELDGGALGRGTQSFLAHCRNQFLDFYVAGATWASTSFSNYWLQCLSVALRRANCRSVRRVLMAIHHLSWDMDFTWLHARVPGGGWNMYDEPLIGDRRMNRSPLSCGQSSDHMVRCLRRRWDAG